MAKKISQLNPASNPDPASEVVIEHAGQNYKLKIEDLLYDNITQRADGGISVTRNQVMTKLFNDSGNGAAGPGFRFVHETSSTNNFTQDFYLTSEGYMRFADVSYRDINGTQSRGTYADFRVGNLKFYGPSGSSLDQNVDYGGAADMLTELRAPYGQSILYLQGFGKNAISGMEMKGSVNIIALRDFDQDSVAGTNYTGSQMTSNFDLRYNERDYRNFNIVNSNGKFGIDSLDWSTSNYSSLFSLYPHKVVDGVDGNGGHYGWGGGTHPVWGQFNFSGAFVLGPLDTSDVTNMLIRENGNGCFYLDQGTSWCFRMREDRSYHRMFINNEGSGGTAGDGTGAGGTTLQLNQELDGFNPQAEIKRNVGTAPGPIAYNVTTDYPGDLVTSHQATLQVQAYAARVALGYMAHCDETKFRSSPNASPIPMTGGSNVGNVVGIYLYGEGLGTTTNGSQNKRSLVPQGNNMDLGNSDSQWRDIFTQNAVTVVSDEKVKQDISSLDDAEKTVAFKLKDLVKKYRLKSSVESKGEEARIHIGWIAQEVEKAFSDEGLDASRYGLFCRDTHYKVFVNGEDTGTVQRTSGQVQDEILYESLEKIYEETGGEKVSTETKNSSLGVISSGENQIAAPKKRKIVGIADEVTFEPFDAYSLRYEELICFIVSAL